MKIKNFIASKFPRLLKIMKCFLEGIDPNQMTVSCFLEDLDPTSKIFKNILDGSSGFPGPRLFHNVRTFMFSKCSIPKNLLWGNDAACFSNSLEYTGVSKDKSYLF